MATPSIINPQLPNVVSNKLDGSNYLNWVAQVSSLLQGYELEKFVTSESTCPPATIGDGSPNPEFASWICQDKLLLGQLFSILTDPVLSKVNKCTSSAQVWAMLERMFASKTEANIIHLRRQLQHIKKGNLSMRDYLAHAKELADALSTAGQDISDMELRHCMLDGLDSSYEPIYASLTTTMSSFTLEDFESFLLNYELHIDSLTERAGVFGIRDAVNEEELKDQSCFDLVVCSLIATVSFTAGITLPGGYISDGPNQGMAVLSTETAFGAFIITNTCALLLSLTAVFSHFCTRLMHRKEDIDFLLKLATYCTLGAIFTMVVAFITGSYAVLAISKGLAITVCVLCSGFLILAFYGIWRVAIQCEKPTGGSSTAKNHNT